MGPQVRHDDAVAPRSKHSRVPVTHPIHRRRGKITVDEYQRPPLSRLAVAQGSTIAALEPMHGERRRVRPLTHR